MGQWCGRTIYISGGGAQEKSPYVAYLSRGRGVALALWVLADPLVPQEGERARQALKLLLEELPRNKGAITTALNAAITYCHRHLQKESILSPDAGGIALTCVAFQRGECYIAQAGPATTYLLQAGRMSALTPAGGESGPVGCRAQLQVAFHRPRLGEQDRLLVTSGTLQQMLPAEGIGAILRSGPLEALRMLFTVARDQQEFSALLLYPC